MVMADWANNAVITADFKQKFAMRAQTMLSINAITNLNDQKIKKEEINSEQYRKVLFEAMRDSHKFNGS
jgi:hypothetical protein